MPRSADEPWNEFRRQRSSQREIGNAADDGTFDLDINLDPDIGYAPLIVRFGAVVSPPVADLAYEWDFGDGAGRGGGRAEHVYRHPGTYEVRLTARTAAGVVRSRSVIVQVDDPSEPLR